MGTSAGPTESPLSAFAPVKDRVAKTLAEGPLFLDVEGLAGQRLTARFLLDGSAWAVETFEVPSDDGSPVIARACAEIAGKSSVESPTRELRGGTHVVELLGLDHDALDRLRALATRDPERVEVEVRAGKETLRTARLADLIAESEALRRQPIVAQAVTSSVRGRGVRDSPAPAGNGIEEKTTCAGLCQLEYEDCLANECGTQFFCETCDVAYQDCLEACQPPPPPPTCTQKVEYFYSTYLYGIFPTGFSQCYPDPWGFYAGVWHDEYAFVYRTDYVQKTTHTDCSVTYQVLSYSYSYFYCYDYTFLSCYPTWYPFNTCY